MNKEKLNEILQKMEKRLDLVVTGVLLFLLILVGYMFLSESNWTLTPPDQPTPLQWSVKLPLERLGSEGGPQPPDPTMAEEYENIQQYILNTNPEIEADDQARRLIQVNMFESRSVEEEEQLREELNRRYQRAETLFEQGEYAQATEIVTEILNQDPTNPNARSLRDRLQQVQP